MTRKLRLSMIVALCCCCLLWGNLALRASDHNDNNNDTNHDNNGFTTPAPGETMSGVVRLRGTATAPEFAKWQVDLLLFGDPERATFIAQARRARNNGNLGLLDTTRYPDGAHTLRLRVVYSTYQHDDYFFPVTIDNSAAPPIINGITAPRNGITVSRTIWVEGIARGPGFQKWQLDLLHNGDANGASTLAVGEEPLLMAGDLAEIDTMKLSNGPHQLRLRVVYAGGNYEDHLTNVLVSNTYTPTAANNGITRPAAGEEVQGAVRVQGIADDPAFRKWQLDLVDLATGDDTFIAWNREPRPARAGFTTFDTTRYPDGRYQLRLRVVRSDYNYSEYFTPITIANGQVANAHNTTLQEEGNP